jgi:choline kinase
MGRLGSYLQKCMYPVGLRPFLELSLAEAVAAGAQRVHVVVGYLQEQIRAYFGDEYAGMELVYVVQQQPLGTGHAVAQLAPLLGGAGSVLVWQADVFVPRELLEQLARHTAPNVLTLVEEEDAPSDVLVTVADARVTRAWRGAGPFSDAGIWRLESGLLAELAAQASPGGEYRMLPNLQLLLDAGRAEVGFQTISRRLHLGGSHPSPEENVATVVGRLLERDRQV